MGTCSWTLALYCRPALKRGRHFRNTAVYAWLGLFVEGLGLSNRKKMYLQSLPSESDRSGLLVHLFLTSLLAPDLRINDVLQTIGQLLAQVSNDMVYVGVLGNASHAGAKLFAGILMSLAGILVAGNQWATGILNCLTGILIAVNNGRLESSCPWLES